MMKKTIYIQPSIKLKAVDAENKLLDGSQNNGLQQNDNNQFEQQYVTMGTEVDGATTLSKSHLWDDTEEE